MREAQRRNFGDIVIQDTSPTAFYALLLNFYTDDSELAFDDMLLVDVLRKSKELELTRAYNHCERRCERRCERGLSADNAVLWFMRLREITLRYLTRNLSKIRAEATVTRSTSYYHYTICELCLTRFIGSVT